MKTRNETLLKLKSLSSINNINLNETKKLLNLLTKSSINIIKDYNLFIKEISFDLLLNKYSIDKINNFDINYLFQMETDSNFIFENPYIGKIFSLMNNENKEIIDQINSYKYLLFKYKIYQDLLSKNENINTDNNYLLSNNNLANNQEANINNNNSIQMNLFISKEENICFTKEKKEKLNSDNDICKNSANKDNEINRNEIIYYPKNFNSFTFGKENKIPKLKEKDSNNLRISHYNPKKDPKLVLLYTSYISTINEKMKLSFNINNDIYYYLYRGIYPKVFLFKDFNNNVKGICTLCYDQNVYSDKKILTITNISCSEGYKLSKLLVNLIEYCLYNHIFFDSIEINLYYIKKDGKFILDEEYENEIKNEAKFKWVKLENDGEKRMIKYHFINNNEINNKENIIKNEVKSNNDSTIVGINLINYTLIKYYQEFGNENIIFSEYSQLYMIINLLKKYYLVNDNNNELYQIIENFKGIKLKKIIRILSEYCYLLSSNPKDFQNDFCKDNNFDINILKQLIEIIEKNKDTDEDLLCLNYNNIFTNFNNIIKTELYGYEYNIISMKDYVIEAFNIGNETEESLNDNNTNFNIYDNNENINIYKNSEEKGNNNNNNEILYFIKSEKEGISFIFYELSDKKEILNQKDIESLFNKVLKKILVKDNEEPIKSFNKICIPSFSYKKMKNKNEIFEDKRNDNLKIIDYQLLYYSDEINFCLENLINNDIKFCFPLSKNVENFEDIKIIKNDFIIAMINPDLVLDYHLPAMNIFYINKSHWIKINQ